MVFLHSSSTVCSKMDRFDYCPSYNLTLPEGLEFYPTDCIIDSVGKDPKTFCEALISILNDEHDLPFNCVVVKVKKRFTSKLIKIFEEKDFKTKIDQYPRFLLINLPEGRAHETLRRELDLHIGSSLHVQLPGTCTFKLKGDSTIQLSAGEKKQPDCSFVTSLRDQELLKPRSLPNILVEIASSETDIHVKEKIIDFARTTRTHDDSGRRLPREQSIDILIVARMNFVGRDGYLHSGTKPPPLSRSRLSSIVFGQYFRRDILSNNLLLQDSNTIKIALDEEGAANFVADPQPFALERESGFTQRNNLVAPRVLITGKGKARKDIELVSSAELLRAAQYSFVLHERQFRVGITPEGPVATRTRSRSERA